MHCQDLARQRQTLTQIAEMAGTLGHGDAYTVAALEGGIVTGLADQGATLERGMELYRLNERPVTVLYGPIPMYRDLRSGSVGVDVEQLETDLAELGYEGFTVDDTFTDVTARAPKSAGSSWASRCSWPAWAGSAAPFSGAL